MIEQNLDAAACTVPRNTPSVQALIKLEEEAVARAHMELFVGVPQV